MHMTDALLSPAVGGVMTAVSVGAIAYSTRRIKTDDKQIPLMGVAGAFVFAAQMVNFAIPGTGASGHIGGGLLLAALLGPHAALLTMASVLLIQCLLFADGGLLAFGCNLFNLGLCVCWFAYGLLYKPILSRGLNRKRIIVASLLASTLGLQMGALGVVLETLLSGVTGLSFGLFATLMMPIHLLIGLAEGIITAGVLCFIHRVRPALLESSEKAPVPDRRFLVVFALVTLLVGGGLSIVASSKPDGLEWSLEKTEAASILDNESNATALMPGYAFPGSEEATPFDSATAGILGAGVILAVLVITGLVIRSVKRLATFRKNSTETTQAIRHIHHD